MQKNDRGVLCTFSKKSKIAISRPLKITFKSPLHVYCDYYCIKMTFYDANLVVCHSFVFKYLQYNFWKYFRAVSRAPIFYFPYFFEEVHNTPTTPIFSCLNIVNTAFESDFEQFWDQWFWICFGKSTQDPSIMDSFAWKIA